MQHKVYLGTPVTLVVPARRRILIVPIDALVDGEPLGFVEASQTVADRVELAAAMRDRLAQHLPPGSLLAARQPEDADDVAIRLDRRPGLAVGTQQQHVTGALLGLVVAQPCAPVALERLAERLVELLRRHP